LSRRLQQAGFGRFLERGKPLVVVNDAFRPTPTGQVLAALRNAYPDFRADFIVACGNHPAPHPDEIKKIFDGYPLPTDSQLFVHDSHNPSLMMPAGAIDGHTVYLNRTLFEYPAVIVIGSVEPHYFAGFTGGRKSLIPGLCDEQTTRRNHAFAVSREARALRLVGNPVADNLDRLMAAVTQPPLFSIQLVTGRDQKLLDCFCGDLATSFAEAIALSTRVYSFPLEKTFDLVIAEMRPPLDRNLYQMQKGIENCAAAVADGGTLIVVSPCREGVGNDEFYRLAERLQTAEAVMTESSAENPPLGIHKLCRVVALSRRITIKALTGLEPSVLRRVFLEPAGTLQEERQQFQQRGSQHVDILLVRDAGVLVAKQADAQ
jgi:nickel-dependent lactate racemase